MFSVVTALIFHSNFSDQMQIIAFLKNIGLAGGFIFIAVNGPKDWAAERKKKYVRL
jgi:putative oxidoreductase